MKRRLFLKNVGLLAAAPFLAAAQQAGGGRGGMTRGSITAGGLQPLDGGKIGNTPAMKITDIKTFLVGAGGRNWVYVKVLTDQGIYGIGEAYSAGPDEATVKVIEDFKTWLIGNDPRNVQYLFDLMYNTTRFPGGIVVNSAMSGIEHALWDIAGKSAGVPVWALLGGRMRNKVRVYQSTGGATPQQAGENAKQMIEKYGYTAAEDGDSGAGRYAVQPRHARHRGARARGARGGRARMSTSASTCMPSSSKRNAPSGWRRRSSRTTRCGWRNRFGPRTTTP